MDFDLRVDLGAMRFEMMVVVGDDNRFHQFSSGDGAYIMWGGYLVEMSFRHSFIPPFLTPFMISVLTQKIAKDVITVS